MIDYRLLQALVAVVQQGGFERAARQLHLTQSAISQRIRQLEEQLGQPVLLRSTPPEPTALGLRLCNHFQQVRQLEAGLGLDAEASAQQVIRLTTNADSLATWLPAALAEVESESGIQVQYELVVEDQDVGLRRMKRGEVMACLCSSAQPVNGGKVAALGSMRYRALLSPGLRQASAALIPDAVHQIPCLVFNRDDRLQHRFLKEQLGLEQEPQQIHLCPSSEGFVQMARAGLGFGMVPELQVQALLASGALVDLIPGRWLDIPLYWHCWQTESPLLALLRQAVIRQAATSLSSA
ncbi:LysR family transcriptional regulator ArgP [Marinospirillum alkaliphilum]|uniref:LysR family transcriptional regulator, chromosome initiation inhibitor n=1 Tax=Marinospirillum alkaliphilum DSM 21637 TaxID=1122209 RepID=A0A1K1Y137_9GAMM|nr:LysR family transcriptional regulator ArgP [Marinospirillum alkaliphilum]SFX55568.1 LysR family transcriptional regulator, chromosome initiation inhibitor [Marinospirillum alkaliphilum DSM 21637]